MLTCKHFRKLINAGAWSVYPVDAIFLKAKNPSKVPGKFETKLAFLCFPDNIRKKSVQFDFLLYDKYEL